MQDTPEPPTDSPRRAADQRVRRGLLLAAEIALVIAIIALLIIIWMPAIVGPHPGGR